MQRTFLGVAGAWTTLAGTDLSPSTGSVRTFTAPSEYKNSYTYAFRVTAYDATTNAQYFTDSHVLNYLGPPA